MLTRYMYISIYYSELERFRWYTMNKFMTLFISELRQRSTGTKDSIPHTVRLRGSNKCTVNKKSPRSYKID